LKESLPENPESQKGTEERILQDLEGLTQRIENAKHSGKFKEGQQNESLLALRVKKLWEIVGLEKGKRVTGYDHIKGEYV